MFNYFFTLLFNYKYTFHWRIVFYLNSIVLLYLTLMPSVQPQSSIQHLDKLFHFIGFGAFAFFYRLAYPKIQESKIILLSCLLGVTVEIIQGILPHRSFSYADMIADFTGILIAVLFLWVGKRKVATNV